MGFRVRIRSNRCVLRQPHAPSAPCSVSPMLREPPCMRRLQGRVPAPPLASGPTSLRRLVPPFLPHNILNPRTHTQRGGWGVAVSLGGRPVHLLERPVRLVACPARRRAGRVFREASRRFGRLREGSEGVMGPHSRPPARHAGDRAMHRRVASNAPEYSRIFHHVSLSVRFQAGWLQSSPLSLHLGLRLPHTAEQGWSRMLGRGGAGRGGAGCGRACSVNVYSPRRLPVIQIQAWFLSCLQCKLSCLRCKRGSRGCPAAPGPCPGPAPAGEREGEGRRGRRKRVREGAWGMGYGAWGMGADRGDGDDDHVARRVDAHLPPWRAQQPAVACLPPGELNSLPLLACRLESSTASRCLPAAWRAPRPR
jgi:hypothetical protein